MFDPIANHLADQYFLMADKAAEGARYMGIQMMKADLYWAMGVRCAYATTTK